MKKILTVFTLLLAVTFLLYKNGNTRSNSERKHPEQVEVHSNTENSNGPTALPSSQKPGPKQKQYSVLSSKAHLAIFQDANQKFETRLNSWQALDRSLPQTADLLYSFAISKNPYTGQRLEAHSFLSLKFSEEESFRIMALQSLEKLALEDPRYSTYLEAIARNAHDSSLKVLSQRMIPYVRKGMSYSLLVQQALGNIQ